MSESESESESEDILVGRRDIASKGLGFLAWLADLSYADSDKIGEYADLYFLIKDSKFLPRYDFAAYSETLQKIYSDDRSHAQKLITLMLKAESEWRVDRAAKEDARASLGLDKKTGKDPHISVVKMKCGFKDRGGRECTNYVVPGSPRCEDHGGLLIDPETRASILMLAYTRLVEGSDTAVQALIEIAESSRSDIARVQAAKEILDRSGLSPELRISFTDGDNTDDKMYRLRQQLEKTKERIISSSATKRELTKGNDDDIVDAELVHEAELLPVESVANGS